MNTLKILLLSVAILFLTNSSWAKLGSLPSLTSDEVHQRLAKYEYDANYDVKIIGRQIIDSEIEKTAIRLSYNDSLMRRQRVVNIDVYLKLNRTSGKTPAILVFPPLNGLTLMDTGFAKYFAQQGYLAVISHVSRDVLDFFDLPSLYTEFTDSVVDNRILVDYLATRSEVDMKNIGVFGVSLGGIRAGLFRGIEHRVKASFLLVGGGNVPGVMSLSQHKDVIALRARFMDKYGFRNSDEFEDALRKGMNWDPIWSSNLRSDDKVYMVLGGRDDRVHTEYQEELLRQTKNAASYRVDLGHSQTSAFIYMNKDLVGNFFKDNLK